MTAATILGSFHYWRRIDVTAEVRAAEANHPAGVDFLADSGAFSAHSTGATVTIPDYAAWLRDHAAVINAAVTLDVIGDPNATERNTARLAEMVGGSVPIVPVFHVGSPWAELERWCRDYQYVCLGGGVGVTHRDRAFLAWLVKAHRVAREHGARLHGLGMTKPPLPERLPFYSVDSSYWSSAARTGTLGLFNPRTRRFHRLRVGTRDVHDKQLADLVRAYGRDPRTLTEPGFARVGARGAPAREERAWLDRASAASWVAYGEHLRRMHKPVKAPDGVAGDGPKLYLAVGDVRSFHKLVDSFAGHPTPAPITRPDRKVPA